MSFTDDPDDPGAPRAADLLRLLTLRPPGPPFAGAHGARPDLATPAPGSVDPSGVGASAMDWAPTVRAFAQPGSTVEPSSLFPVGDPGNEGDASAGLATDWAPLVRASLAAAGPDWMGQAPTKPAQPAPSPDIAGLSQRFESARGGPGTVSSGNGDAGGVSYGSYQMATTPGTLTAFLAKEGAPWAKRFQGLTPGSPEFSQAWKAVAREEPAAFQQAQNAFVMRVYYGGQRARILRDTGIDIAQRSPGLQSALLAGAIHLGQNTGAYAQAINKLRRAGGAPPDDRAIIQAIYAERGRKGPDGRLVHFISSAPAVQRGVAARLLAEQNAALAMLAPTH